MVSPTKKRGPFSNRRSARPCANRRPAESRHHNGSVIIAGARLRHFCACQPFVPYVTVARTAKSGEGVLYVAVHPDGAAQGNPVGRFWYGRWRYEAALGKGGFSGRFGSVREPESFCLSH